jgi:hypothetical protein
MFSKSSGDKEFYLEEKLSSLGYPKSEKSYRIMLS